MLKVAFVSVAVCAADRARGRRPGPCEGACDDCDAIDAVDSGLSLEALAAEISASECVISTGVLAMVEVLSPFTDNELADLCAHRPRTPSTALKKLVELEAIVREIASRVGASCSWI